MARSGLLLLPPDAGDRGSQRCRLGPRALSVLGLRLGSPVRVCLPGGIALCAAWPRGDRAEGFLQLDTKCATPGLVGRPCRGLSLGLGHLHPVSCIKLRRVCVRAVLAGPGPAPGGSEALLKELLRNVYLCAGFVVTVGRSEPAAWPGLLLLEVATVEPSSGGVGLLGARSRLEVVEVLSLERFRGLELGLGLGGLEQAASPLREMLKLPLSYPRALGRLGLPCPRGILLLGPPGVGKTALVRAVARELGATVLEASPAAIQGSRPGESEQRLRRLFERARAEAQRRPCLLFIDDMESLFPRRAVSGNRPEDRLVAQLLTLMDGLGTRTRLVVVATSSSPEALEPALRRPGRLDREKDPVDNEITFADFCEALKIVQPSCLRSSIGLTDIRPVQWDQIGGLDQVKLKLRQSIEWPAMYPEAFVRMGVTPTCGILLYGPPGCAKTMLVKAAASSCRCSFLSVSGADLFSPFVGDSEKALAQVFRQARAGAPSVLFLDEIDSMLGSRSLNGTNGRSVEERVLSVLLNEMDGIGQPLAERRGTERKILVCEGEQSEQIKKLEFQEVCNKGVIVVAATNRPDLLDDALLRPGRFDQIIFVPSPDKEARLSILRIYTSKTPLDDVSLEELATETAGFTGADIQNLCKEAALLALQENGLDAAAVKHGHFLSSLQSLKPSLTGQQLDFYHNLFSTSDQ
ncbi:spermatogenesis-associated protein 5-like protein 1 isoform X3 [Heterodontus francisci]|uniref:spermatogenesis-associated protein 5-like protein 1 isoform X3 n=1 Tax=Heterodontus francisci TaxID=7792 RepID=UPI00355AE0E9